MASMTANNGFVEGIEEETKGAGSGAMSPPMSKDIGDILEDLQNNQL